MVIFVGVGDLGLSTIPGHTLKTMALGSCIAVVAYSRKIQVAGMLHFQLPDSTINKDLAHQKPAMFADTGIALLLKEMLTKGVPISDICIKLVGGAQIMDPNNTFNIGKRNYLAAKKLLWINRIMPVSEDVGGSHSRTIAFKVGEEKIALSSPGLPDWTI